MLGERGEGRPGAGSRSLADGLSPDLRFKRRVRPVECGSPVLTPADVDEAVLRELINRGWAHTNATCD